jgi:hypothetical protein
MSEDITLEYMMDVIEEAADGISAVFEKPDDDWLPMAHVLSGDADVTVIAVDTRFLETEETKDLLLKKYIIPTIKRLEGRAFGLLTSVWMFEASLDDVKLEELDTDNVRWSDVGVTNPSTDPRRIEAVWIEVYGPEGSMSSFAKIIRSPTSPPMLTEWTRWPDLKMPGGRFGSVITTALKEVQEDV